uniref:HTH CENPB-type domain-containing protein n=1 Tax=Periophthalmus magnuspinnatus TaxID=409849 RepID=A0A3B3ZNC3_9GOBI
PPGNRIPRKWSEKRMEAAINQYQQELQFGKKAKVRLLARTWKVPRSTLQRRVKGGVRRVFRGSRLAAGRKALLTPEAEKDLLNSLTSLSEQGVSLTPTVVRTMAFQYAKANGISGFSETKGKAGFYWFKGFSKRNPNVCLNMSGDLSDVNSDCSLETETKEVIGQEITEVPEEIQNIIFYVSNFTSVLEMVNGHIFIYHIIS